MPFDGYGEETRFKRRVNTSSKITSTGVSLYDSHSFKEEQVTVSYRTPQRGKLVADSVIDPYCDTLRLTAERKLDKNRVITTPIVVGGRAIAYSPHRDNGHAFRSQERKVVCSVRVGTHYVSNSALQRTGGPYYATQAIVAAPHRSRMPFLFEGAGEGQYTMGKIPRFTMPDLSDFGKKAIVVLAPGYAKSPLFTATGELFVGVPQVIGHTLPQMLVEAFSGRKHNSVLLAKGAASEFLNYVFGILPTVEDAVQIIENFKVLSDRLLQLEADSGTGVRRKMTFTVASKSERFELDNLSSHGRVTGASSGSAFGGISSTSSAGTVANSSISSSLQMLQTREVSFSGSFSRFVSADPKLPEMTDRFYGQFLKALTKSDALGVYPSRERLWQLVPFSWLVDWFLSLKRSLALFDRLLDDSLVINYGYVMATTKRHAIQTSQLTYEPAKTASSSRFVTTYSSTTVERVRANPYGFITPGALELNPLRVGILSALGITLWR